jgi:hypothetical protein
MIIDDDAKPIIVTDAGFKTPWFIDVIAVLIHNAKLASILANIIDLAMFMVGLKRRY